MRWIPKLMFAFLAGLLAAGVAWGTGQAPDILILKGKQQALNTNPLSGWLQTHPDRLPRDGVNSTANWRGYVATWEISQGRLWLRKVTVEYHVEGAGKGEFEFEDRDVTDRLFPGQRDIVAQWYSGTLIVPTGKLINYVHMGYGSTYERYTVVWVDRGEVRKSLDLSAEQFTELRKERFRAFQRTPEFQKQLAKMLADDGKDADREQTIDFMYQFYAEEYLSAEPR